MDVEHDPQHYAWELFTPSYNFGSWTPAYPLLIMAWVCAIYYLTKRLGSARALKAVKRRLPCFRVDLKGHEDTTKIDDYWRCLDDDDR